jgi:hypothetical protein
MSTPVLPIASLDHAECHQAVVFLTQKPVAMTHQEKPPLLFRGNAGIISSGLNKLGKFSTTTAKIGFHPSEAMGAMTEIIFNKIIRNISC